MIKSKIIKKGVLADEKEWVKHIESLKTGKKSSKSELKKQIIRAVEERIPKKIFGIFFSGGIDSSLIALICKNAKADFVCYAVGLENASDIEAAKKAAKLLGVELKFKIFTLKEAEAIIKEVTKTIGPDVMKVGVGSVVYAAAMLAKKDKIDVFFSGLGSEELFAGYERHADVKDVNLECWRGLESMYSRDFLRDYYIAKKLKITVLTPFLDSGLIKTAMQIPGEKKISKEYKKVVLREIAEELGLPKEIAWRKKKAAQYGSRFHKALQKLSKKSKCRRISEYLFKFYSPDKMKLGALISSGKDSIYAMYKMMQRNYRISCMITLKSINPDSYMFHTAAIGMAKIQSKAVGIPIIEVGTKGEKEKELEDLKKALEKAKKDYGIKGIVTGALYSTYQRERIERLADSLGLEMFSPLWHMDQEALLREIISSGFKFILTKVAAEGLNKNWLNRVITNKDVDKLAELNRKIGMNVAFEGGEAETLMISGPIFKKSIIIEDAETIMEKDYIGELKIKKDLLFQSHL